MGAAVEAAALLEDMPEVFTHGDARRAGWSDRVLYAMRDQHQIDQVARGIYARPELSADYDLVEIAVRAPNAVICLGSALAHHELTDEIPARIDVALPRSQRPPRTQAPTAWHRFDPDTFEIGRTSLSVTDTVEVGLYSPVRTIVDAYRLRHLYGTEMALEALKRWLGSPGNQPSALLAMASHFPPAVPIIRTTLQTLL